MNPTVLIICGICMVIAIILDNKTKFPLGVTCMLFAFVVGYFGLNLAPRTVVNYFPITVVMPLILAMIYFSVFTANGTSQIMAKKILGMVKGNMKAFPWVMFLLSTVLYFCLDGGALRYIIGPLVFSIAKAGGMSTLMSVSTAYMPFIAGSLNPFINIDATTRLGIFQDMGLQNAQSVSIVVWLNLLVAIIITHLVVYLITGSFKLKNTEFKAEDAHVTVNAEQKKSFILLAATIVIFIVPPLLNTIVKSPFTKQLSTILCNYTIFILGILAVLALGLGEWRNMVNKASMRQIMMITGVTMLIKVAQQAGLQELCINIANSVPTWLIAPVLLIICAFLSFFVAAPTVQPMLFPMAAAMATTPVQAITYLTCVALGLAASGISPISNSGAAFLSTVADEDREKYSKSMYAMAFLGPIVMAIVAAVGGMSIFSGIFSSWYY